VRRRSLYFVETTKDIRMKDSTDYGVKGIESTRRNRMIMLGYRGSDERDLGERVGLGCG
jgi:hypothetical protein